MIAALAAAGLLLLAAPSPEPSPSAAAPSVTPTTVTGGSVSIFGGSFTVPAGEVREGNVAVYGGSVDIEGSVTHDLRVYGGSAVVNGSIGHDVAVFGGSADLGPHASVGHDVTVVGGALHRDPGAVIGHNVTEESSGFDHSGLFPFGPPSLPQFGSDLGAGLALAIGVVLLALLLQLFFPGHVSKTRDAIEDRPFAALGYGCLTAVAGVLLAALLGITIVLLPASLAIAVAMGGAWLLGLAAAMMLIGQRLTAALSIRTDPVPTLLVGGVLVAVLLNVPILGALFGLVIGSIALGAVVLTRFGTRRHPPGPPSFVHPQAEVK